MYNKRSVWHIKMIVEFLISIVVEVARRRALLDLATDLSANLGNAQFRFI